MTALHSTGNPALRPTILSARKFIADTQHFGGDVYDGGFGYDKRTQRAYADGLNTFYTAQAMAVTADVWEELVSHQCRGRQIGLVAAIDRPGVCGARKVARTAQCPPRRAG